VATTAALADDPVQCRFPELATAVAALEPPTLLLDGEIAVFDRLLPSRFEWLRARPKDEAATPPTLVAFDCLYAPGKDLRARPLRVRRNVLEDLVDDQRLILPAPRLAPDGFDAWAQVVERGYEELVGKDEASPYREGRTLSWLKVKVPHYREGERGGSRSSRTLLRTCDLGDDRDLDYSTGGGEWTMPEWLRDLQDEVFRLAIPFTFEPRAARTSREEMRSGTCVVVKNRVSQFLITAAHNVEPALEMFQARQVDCLAGRVRLPIGEMGSIHLSRRADIATIVLSEDHVRALEYDNWRVLKVEKWPPAEDLAKGDPVMFAGFPGAWRVHTGSKDVDFPGRVSVGFIGDPGDDQFSCHLDPEFTERNQTAGLPELSVDDVAGMSGGPAFLVRREAPKPVPQLCGIIKEGKAITGGHLIFFFTRVACISSDGRIGG